MHSYSRVIAIATVFGILTAIPSLGSAQTTALPPGWSASDIGSPTLSGSTTHSGDSLTLRASGAGIGSTADQFHFAYRSVTGDIDMSVRVADLQTIRGQAGLMIRESRNVDAPAAFIALRSTQDVAFQTRARAGRKMSIIQGPASGVPVWLRLIRQGRTFQAYTSHDGAAWALVGSANIRMNASVLIGLAVSSHEETQFTSAVLSSSIFGTPTPTPVLPAPWSTSDIGSPSLAGSASEANNVFTVSGTGWDIWDVTDQFRFVYQPVTGDTQIVARVASLEAAHAWAKAGVMIRAALTGPSTHASLFATEGNGWSFQRRAYDGGVSLSTSSPGAAPGWVRLVREGQLISAYQSADGSNWTLIGTDTVQMPDAVYIGLAVTSHDATATAIGTFSSAGVSVPTYTNMAPSVSITTPAGGATFTAPASITVSASASDSDGLVSKVDLFANGVLIGSSMVSPFSISWSNVTGGSYSLTAVATDNEGSSTISSPVAITVASAPAVISNVAFTPPVDYATNVTSVAVEIRRATDSVTTAPVAARDLGKPATTSGDIVIDISSIVDPLAAGSYYAIIVAKGPGGTTPSTPSPAFTK